MMTDHEVEYELHTCGLWFFVQFYEQLEAFTNGSIDDQETIRRDIMTELKAYRRPDGHNYQNTGTDMRIASAFVIFKKKGEIIALEHILHSNRIDYETKSKAKGLLSKERNKQEEINLDKHEETIINKEEAPGIILNEKTELEHIDNQTMIYNVDNGIHDLQHVDNSLIIRSNDKIEKKVTVIKGQPRKYKNRAVGGYSLWGALGKSLLALIIGGTIIAILSLIIS